MKRRIYFLLLACTVLLSACGFALRQPPQFAFTSLYSGFPSGSGMGQELLQTLRTSTTVNVITDPAQLNQAQVILDVFQEQREKIVVGTTASGQVREFELRQRLRFRLRTPQGRELIPETELLQIRDISHNESAVLSKEGEEALLYRDMQTTMVNQLMRRLAAVKP